MYMDLNLPVKELKRLLDYNISCLESNSFNLEDRITIHAIISAIHSEIRGRNTSF